eukprot:3299580-Amphidinium_carterae.1
MTSESLLAAPLIRTVTAAKMFLRLQLCPLSINRNHAVHSVTESLPLRSSVVEKMHSGSIVVRPSSPISRPLSARTPKADGSVAKAGSTDFPNSAIPWMFATTGGSCLEPSLDHPEVRDQGLKSDVYSGQGNIILPCGCHWLRVVKGKKAKITFLQPVIDLHRWGVSCTTWAVADLVRGSGEDTECTLEIPGEFQIRAQLRREKKAADNRASRRAGKGSESRVPLRPGLIEHTGFCGGLNFNALGARTAVAELGA